MGDRVSRHLLPSVVSGARNEVAVGKHLRIVFEYQELTLASTDWISPMKHKD